MSWVKKSFQVQMNEKIAVVDVVLDGRAHVQDFLQVVLHPIHEQILEIPHGSVGQRQQNQAPIAQQRRPSVRGRARRRSRSQLVTGNQPALRGIGPAMAGGVVGCVIRPPQGQNHRHSRADQECARPVQALNLDQGADARVTEGDAGDGGRRD
jgi:hypothetical protein